MGDDDRAKNGHIDFSLFKYFLHCTCVYKAINEQIQKGHKDALQERIEGSKGKMEAKPQVKKK